MLRTRQDERLNGSCFFCLLRESTSSCSAHHLACVEILAEVAVGALIEAAVRWYQSEGGAKAYNS
jgi:hypothetical protein